MFSKNCSTHTLYAMNLKENMKEDMNKPHKINIKHYQLHYFNSKTKRAIWSDNIH